ncbi:MAG: hypothetical protein CYPHOPRED_000312 [Cyphobasidiales sp. Tagirdzhanova-0007]|nr:MAG: hypothetical protein CYPHOPRED_000312 [Cyphobasidiales sp. Tagirdzhanova-0007]
MPPNSLPLMRFLRIVQEQQPDLLETASIKLFNCIFAQGDSDVFKCELDKLRAILGPDFAHTKKVEDMLVASNGKENTERLRKEAKELVEDLGAFGAPWMHFTKNKSGESRSIMGSDRFEIIANWLEVPYQVGNVRSLERAKL